MNLAHRLQNLALLAIGSRVRSVTGSTASLDVFATPVGDPGLFGPQAVCWRVHAHFGAMMCGGLSSLMVQALHPRALAAVWDHSDFRTNLKGRLGRTAYFVAATTYGPRPLAMRTIARVNAIHAQATGTDLQGQPYVASDPQLLAWVHLVEVTSFLSAYQHLARQTLPVAECDRYIEEMAQIGHLLGAVDLPTTLCAARARLMDFQPQLAFDARTRQILRIIESYPADLVDQPFMALVLRSAFDVMPDWALRLTGRTPACEGIRQAQRRALQLAVEPVQWMLDQQGVAALSLQRIRAGDGAPNERSIRGVNHSH